MDFQVKISEIGGNHIFRDRERINKVSLMFLDVQMVTERYH